MHSLEKHLETRHKEQFKEYNEQKESTKKRKVEDTTVNNCSKQQKITDFQAESMIMNLCVDLVTINGRPFTLFSDDSMKKIIKLSKEAAKDKTEINPENVKKAVKKRASTKRDQLIKLFKGRLVNLSIDMATCGGRSFFGKIFFSLFVFNKFKCHYRFEYSIFFG